MTDMEKKLEAVIFDLDGTLWDARANICVSWNETLRTTWPDEYRPIPEGDFTAQMGKLLNDIGDELISWLPPEERYRAVELCCENENRYLAGHGGILFGNEEETLRALSEKYRLYVVSNCQSGYIEAFFASNGLDKYFSGFTCNGDTGLLKGDNIRLIMEKNGITNAVYVGDTQLDRDAAVMAGVPFIWASYGFGTPDGFDAEAKRFDELAGICGDAPWQ